MMTDDEITPGEIRRALRRLEDGQARLETAIAPLGVLAVRVDGHEKAITALEADVKAITVKSATVAGGISVIGFLAQFWGHRG